MTHSHMCGRTVRGSLVHWFKDRALAVPHNSVGVGPVLLPVTVDDDDSVAGLVQE